MRVGVTGGAGFIGKTVEQQLYDRGMESVDIDHSSGVDILGPELFDALEPCDAVIHLAGVLGTSELFDSAEEAIDVNIKGTLRVLQAAQELKLAYVGITMPGVWDNVYQATKKAARSLASAWHRHHGVPVSHVRAYNVFGPKQKIGLPQKIIPTFCSHAYANRPIPIWGDGEQTVDLVYVRDVARMLVDALNFGDDSTFDAGTGQRFSVNQVAAMVLAYTHSDAGVEHLPMRKGEHGAGVVSHGEGWTKLGWRPEFRMQDFTYTLESYRSVIMGQPWMQPNLTS